MKLRFTPEDLSWIHSKLSGLVQVAGPRPDSQYVATLARKAAYRCTGAPAYVKFKRAERNLVRDLAAYAHENAPSLEEKLVGSRILEVLTTAEDEAYDASND